MKKNLRQISIDELHNLFYECLSYFDDFCSKNNLKYAAIWGTLLGCVRDKKIIPWDGDVDLVMPYEDYDRLKELKNIFDNAKYELTFPSINQRTYSNELRIKINNVFWKQKNQRGSYDRRVAIDIFIATPMSDNEEESMLVLNKFSKVRRLLALKYDCMGHSNKFKKICHSLLSGILVVVNGKKLHDQATSIERSFIGRTSEDKRWFCPQASYTKHLIFFTKQFFTNVDRKPFGPILINCPNDYHEFLDLAYGNNWMTPINRNPSDDFETYFIKES